VPQDIGDAFRRIRWFAEAGAGLADPDVGGALERSGILRNDFPFGSGEHDAFSVPVSDDHSSAHPLRHRVQGPADADPAIGIDP